ncbi:MAG: hypothetical protein KGL39_01460 [Patescibacteria group bacterium]|nr:hypothetical protein [Patescibacteria group bacterium]
MNWIATAAVCIIILLIALACVFVFIRRRARVITGGAAAIETWHVPTPTPLEFAIERYTRGAPVVSLGSADLTEWGGAASPAAKHWSEIESWEELSKNRRAVAEYSKDRVEFLNSLDVGWGGVLTKATPLLGDNREHIGTAVLGKGRQMQIVHMEPSTTAIGDSSAPIAASIPAEQVARVASRPALVLFHTHPDHPHIKALPSPADFLAAIDDGFHGRFAAHAIVCNYGVVLYTLSHEAITDIQGTKYPELSLLYFKRDVIGSYASVRSWRKWTLDDLKNMFLRHKLIFAVYPSGKYVSDAYWLKFKSHQDAAVDWDKEFALREEIEKRTRLR